MLDARYWLQENLSKALNLPMSAVDWLMSIWDMIQLFDDVADCDPITREELDKVIWCSLVSNHRNEFLKANAADLLPLVESMIMKWQASDEAERAGEADARSFMWRAGYYDLVLMATRITHGSAIAQKAAKIVMNMYGEKIEDYLEEFKSA